MKKLMAQIMKFGIVGVISFLIDFGIFKLLSSVFGVYYLIANFFGFSISVVFNYVMSMKYVFEPKENADKRAEFIIFVVLSLIGLGLNELIIWFCMDIIYQDIPALQSLLSRGLMETGGKLLATAIVMVYNFITRKIFLEKK